MARTDYTTPRGLLPFAAAFRQGFPLQMSRSYPPMYDISTLRSPIAGSTVFCERSSE